MIIPCPQVWQFQTKYLVLFFGLISFSCSDLGKEKGDIQSRPFQTEFKVEDFSSAEDCKSCHPTHFAEWASSMHAYSAKDPVWLKLQQHEQAVHLEKGIELGDFCVQCHSPVAALTDAITNHESFSLSDLEALPPQIQEGVTCDICHMVTHIPEPTNVLTEEQSFETTDFKLFTDGTRYSILNDPVENEYHASEYHSGYDKSEFCQNCHNLSVNGIDAEVTQFEWEGTAFQAMGSECQTCHMQTYEGRAATDGPLRSDLHRHFFPGVDVQLNTANPDPEHYSAVEALLLEAAEVYINDIYHDSLINTLNLSLIITNNVGHKFPTGTTFARQLWIELSCEVNENIIFSSGFLDENGDVSDFYVDPGREIDPQLQMFNTVLYNAEGDSGLLNVGVSDMVKLNDYTLPVSGSKSVHYTVPLPDNFEGNTTISVRLLFRSFPPFYLRFLGLNTEAERIPIFEIDQKTAQFVISQ